MEGDQAFIDVVRIFFGFVCPEVLIEIREPDEIPGFLNGVCVGGRDFSVAEADTAVCVNIGEGGLIEFGAGTVPGAIGPEKIVFAPPEEEESRQRDFELVAGGRVIRERERLIEKEGVGGGCIALEEPVAMSIHAATDGLGG